MVSPNLIKKKESSFTVDSSAKKLFQLIYIKKNKLSSSQNKEANISVSNMGSKLAFFYEKVRNAVDYDEDYLLRKNAIKRILKRQILIEGIIKKSESENIAIHLLTELIQAGYLPNNSIPEKKIYEISEILEKYIKLKYYSFQKESFFSILSESFGFKSKRKRTSKAKNLLINWLMSLAAAEIEENLSDDVVRKEMVNDMFEILKDNIKLPKDLPFKNDLEIQIYLSICRSFLRYDNDSLNLVIFKYYNKDWKKADDQQIIKISEKIDKLYLATSNQLKHPLIKQLDKIIKSYSLYFSVLHEAIDENPLKVYEFAVNNYKAFISFVKEIIEKRYRKIKRKLWRSGWRSIIYIFLTKSIFVFALEIPAIKFFGEEMNPVSLAINVMFPAFLLFVMILFTWSPAKENEKKILEGLEEIVFAEKRQKYSIVLRKPIKRNFVMDFIFNLLYLTGFSITIYAIINGLSLIDFNWVNITIFLFFLTFVSFFSFRIKRDIKRFIIIEPKEGFVSFLFDFFYMPIVAMGKFLSDNVSKINVFIFVLDFVIEVPFKVFVEIFDDWVKYIKEKKEDLIN
ncbi:hypothetical protein CVU82_02160 [Candidatus Falkowbacteria bacterium HGW-Falkowbacteria-1]|uniref:Uncharacterized protein n=1 Tax=Candidatus Falkowbacteria bacterium HGW-Falkowbacteria-1 TaxID=2013768 RepID=A0A2N2E9L9_9BACT|nr:MAG: hypothetical protein CVU82_02160 [Candidatus Falkowbacteria bacterium HGW-Falkowbacteria-1]